MTTYNTGNPIGSTAVKDLYDNAENLDHATNDRSTRVWNDRFGVARRTWHGMEQDFQDFLVNSGYQDIGEYGPGLEITARNQVFWRDGELYRAGAALELPYTTTGDWGAEGGSFVAVGDAALRQQLADTDDPDNGASMIGFKHRGSGAVARSQQDRDRDTFHAEDYGFHVDASAAANSEAIRRAVIAAEKTLVTVNNYRDFELSNCVLEDLDVNLKFIGSGRVQRVDTNPVIAGGNSFLGITLVSDITVANLTLDGATGPATRVTVADASPYRRGDIVKVVADDIWEPARKEERRIGEHATVIAVDVPNNHVWLSGYLRFQNLYLTNVRMGIMQQRVFNVRGLKVDSNFSLTGAIVTMRGLYQPVIEMQARDVGTIGLNVTGCYQAKVYASGNGMGNASGSLGYLVNDISSEGTQIINPRGAHWRHMTTTNHNAVEAGSDRLDLYGPCIDQIVIDGVSYASEGAPYDSHEGAIGTKWIRCTARGYVTNPSTAAAGFQLRGIDEQIIEPYIDGSFNYSFRLGPTAAGNVRISGGFSNARRVLQKVGASLPTLNSVVFDNFHQVSNYSPASMFPGSISSTVVLNGGTYEYGYLTSASDLAEFITLNNNSNYVLNDPLFFVRVDPSNPPSSQRFIRATGPGRLTGRFKAGNDGNYTPGHYFSSAPGSGATVRAKVAWVQGTRPARTNTSGFADLAYVVSDYTTNPPTTESNRSLFDDYLRDLAAL